MALYDGFFDAVLDENTLQYDRTYNSGDFTGYFGEFVGSGVCIHENEDSFKVSWNGAAAEIDIGYLFIQGFWARIKDDPYVVPISGQGVHAVLAWLNMGANRIEVGSQLKADPEVYPDALVLAYVTIDSAGTATVEDTRYNTDICGVIDSAGGLSDKVEYAIQYIDNEIEDRLSQIEEDLEVQAATLDAKIAEVNAMVEKLAPPPIGTIKFSASQDIEEGWLRCDGSFINEADYPELVAALGKVTPGVTEFTENAKGRIPMDISNGVLYNGRFWVFSYSTKTLYGISLSDDTVKEIAVTGIDLLISPRTSPIYLSILSSSEIFLAQHDTSSTGVKNIRVYHNNLFDDSLTAIDLLKLEFDNFDIKEGTATTSSSSYPIKIRSALYVSKIDDIYHISVGYSTYSGQYIYLMYYSWDADTVPPINTGSRANASRRASSASAAYTFHLAIPAFSGKNFGYHVQYTLSESGYVNSGSISAIPSGFISSASHSSINPENYADAEDRYPSISVYDGNAKLLMKYYVDGGNFYSVCAGTQAADPPAIIGAGITSLPSISKAFQDAAIYMAEQELWTFFVGTGIVFTRDLSDPSQYGFLDTQDTLGTITQFGYIEHDPATNKLYILGQDTTNTVKLGVLDIPPLYNYANDGAWLPMIASDGIPAYIKAKEPAEGA